MVSATSMPKMVRGIHTGRIGIRVRSTSHEGKPMIIAIPNVGKGRLFNEEPERPDPSADTMIERPEAPGREVEDRVESVPHVVQKGDTLSKIAQHYYGDASLYPKIFEANRDVLKDPNLIRIGQKLRIP